MARILNIETATHVCSVTLSEDGKVVARRENKEGRSHASLLSYFIGEILEEQKIRVADMDAVSISQGPGSYTGLRIGVSTAKGLCYGAGIPLIAVPTLQSLAAGVLEHLHQITPASTPDAHTLLAPMLDARRMEVYSALYNTRLEEVREVKPEIIDANSYSDWLKEHNLIFFGSGAPKVQEVVSHKNARFIEGVELSSQYMIQLSEDRYKKQQFEDVAYFEPFYLKEFIATRPRKNIIRRMRPDQ